jgi:hypothetical protein
VGVGGLLVELVPGFAVFFQVRSAGSANSSGIEADVGASVNPRDRNDVPGVERADVGDDEIDLLGRILRGALIVDEVDGVSPGVGGGEGGLDLDANEAAAFAEDEVERLAVSEGFADGEAEFGGFEREGQFGEFSFTLGEWRRRSSVADGWAGLGEHEIVFHIKGLKTAARWLAGGRFLQDFEHKKGPGGTPGLLSI